MTTFIIITAIATSIAALVGTLLVGKDVSSKLKEYEKKGDTLENTLARSNDYETNSLRVNIRSLTWIYVVLTVVIIVVCLAIFFY